MSGKINYHNKSKKVKKENSILNSENKYSYR